MLYLSLFSLETGSVAKTVKIGAPRVYLCNAV